MGVATTGDPCLEERASYEAIIERYREYVTNLVVEEGETSEEAANILRRIEADPYSSDYYTE